VHRPLLRRPGLAASADFAIDKPAGAPCPNLRDDDRCGIHERLRDSGFPGCAVFDCLGAGQHDTQGTFGGRSRRESPELAGAMFAVLPVMRQLRETLWYLAEAASLAVGGVLDEVRTAQAQTSRLSDGTPPSSPLWTSGRTGPTSESCSSA
jgi:hypothetical protein